jgi:hypothetical protein
MRTMHRAPNGGASRAKLLHGTTAPVAEPERGPSTGLCARRSSRPPLVSQDPLRAEVRHTAFLNGRAVGAGRRAGRGLRKNEIIPPRRSRACLVVEAAGNHGQLLPGASLLLASRTKERKYSPPPRRARRSSNYFVLSFVLRGREQVVLALTCLLPSTGCPGGQGFSPAGSLGACCCLPAGGRRHHGQHP